MPIVRFTIHVIVIQAAAKGDLLMIYKHSHHVSRAAHTPPPSSCRARKWISFLPRACVTPQLCMYKQVRRPQGIGAGTLRDKMTSSDSELKFETGPRGVVEGGGGGNTIAILIPGRKNGNRTRSDGTWWWERRKKLAAEGESTLGLKFRVRLGPFQMKIHYHRPSSCALAIVLNKLRLIH